MKRTARKVAAPQRSASPHAWANPFANGSGKYATQRFLEAIKAGAKGFAAFQPALLRTLDTLRHEEWKNFDVVLVEEALRRQVGVSDLMQAGLTRPVANSLGKTVHAYEKVTFMDVAEVSMDGETKTDNDRQEFLLANIPLPMTHKDFNIDLRTLTASRDQGEPLDTTQVRTAGKVIGEAAETMLFQGGPTFGGLPIYGYTTFPTRHLGSYATHGNWTTANTAKTGGDIVDDALTYIQTLVSDRKFGPYWLYVGTDTDAKLSQDYVGTGQTFSTKTIRQRLLEIGGIQKVQVADFMPAATVVLVQADMDTVAWVQGETLQTVQWDEAGGFKIKFKAFQIGVPLIRSDAQGRTGIVHAS